MAQRSTKHQSAFLAFHARYPEIYRELVAVARRVKAAGFSHYGFSAVWERVRWHFAFEADAPSDGAFKLNNNFRSYYTRLIMALELDLAGFFDIRDCKPASYRQPIYQRRMVNRAHRETTPVAMSHHTPAYVALQRNIARERDASFGRAA